MRAILALPVAAVLLLALAPFAAADPVSFGCAGVTDSEFDVEVEVCVGLPSCYIVVVPPFVHEAGCVGA